jgi:hypothetical protein
VIAALSRASPREGTAINAIVRSWPTATVSATSGTRKRGSIGSQRQAVPVSGSDRTAPAGYGTGAGLEYLLICLASACPSSPSSGRTIGARGTRGVSVAGCTFPHPRRRHCERMRLELPWLCGRVAELGRKHGLATPVNDTVVLGLKLHSDGRS